MQSVPTIKIVIGAGYGDEGKGLVTDYLANQCEENSIVVRYNGGAQAGHTVVIDDQTRHVFSHIGSGAFRGARTYLSKFFIVNPALFNEEFSNLKKKIPALDKIYVSRDAIVTTPYDILMNQIIENSRGNDRHGSCGVGIFETIRRSKKVFLTTYSFLFILTKRYELEHILDMICDYYIDLIHDLNIKVTDEQMSFYTEKKFHSLFLNDIVKMNKNIILTEDSILCRFTDIIFEGAQGLLLDEQFGEFPHLTPSKTGLDNPIEILNELGLPELNVELYYVTRAYATRHGAGPLKDESSIKDLELFVQDETNTNNKFQGMFRYGKLDINRLKLVTAIDACKLTKLRNVNDVVFTLVVTCLDQFVDKKKRDGIVAEIVQTVKPECCLLSYGQTEKTIMR